MPRSLTLFMLVVGCGWILWQIQRTKSGGPLPKIRKIAAIEAIPEVIGRAVEMGRPVHFTSGVGKIDDEFAPQTIAATEILSHISKLCADYDAEIVTTVAPALVLPIQEDAMRAGYTMAGKPENFSPDQIRFASETQMAYASAAVGFITREKAAANIMIGAFYGETMLIAEAGVHAGAVQIMGTVRMYQLMFMAVVADYLLIGEEMFAAGAYIAQDRVRLGAVKGQDHIKVALIAILVVAFLGAVAGNTLILDLLKKYGN
ncbi:MAG: hypothetical protein Q8P31_11595 [Bacillota bacterium]|nr:hypothetical protein [Bacillota bacterium]